MNQQPESVRLKRMVGSPLDSNTQLVGTSPAMQELLRKIEEAALVDLPILIEGEAGVGKKLVAMTLHRFSRNASQPLLIVPSITARLEGENISEWPVLKLLQRLGGGTLLITGTEDLPLLHQAQFHGIFERYRHGLPSTLDSLSFIFTSNVPPGELLISRIMDEGLWFDLNVVTLHVPPLRERAEDIPTLVQHFLQSASAPAMRRSSETPSKGIGSGFARPIPQRGGSGEDRRSPPLIDIDIEALYLLARHPWPGNVQELKEAVYRALRRATGPILTPSDFLFIPSVNAWVHDEELGLFSTPQVLLHALSSGEV